MRQKVLITGVSSGLGMGLAQAYLERDAEVYALSRRKPPASMKRIHFESIDLGDLGNISFKLAGLLQEVTDLDLVILNAGVLSEFGDVRDTPLSEMKNVMDVNVWSNKVLIDSLFEMQLNVKQVVAISSGAAVSGSRGWNAYALSKAALNMLMRLYAAEHLETHFSALAPGLIDTAMQDYIGTLQPDDKYPTVGRLQAARGTAAMPAPEQAAAPIIKAIEASLKLESGVFTDIRNT